MSAQPGEEWPGHAVLQVPVPVLEPYVRARYERYDPRLLAREPGHVHAHLTVLGPVPRSLSTAQQAGLTEVFARAGEGPLRVGLAEVATFPDGLVHVRLADPRPLRALTAAVREVLPGWEPYGGRTEPEPHVTIDQLGPGVTLDGVRRELAPVLPVEVLADRVELVWYRADEVGVLRSWPLGARAPRR